MSEAVQDQAEEGKDNEAKADMVGQVVWQQGVTLSHIDSKCHNLSCYLHLRKSNNA